MAASDAFTPKMAANLDMLVEKKETNVGASIDERDERDESSLGSLRKKDETHVDGDVAEKNTEEKDGDGGGGERPEDQYITGIKLFTTMAAVTCVFFLVFLDISIISTAIPSITNDFHALQDVGWYGSAYLLASCSLQPLAGKLYTHLPVKIVFLAFFGIFELGSLLCGVATSSTMFIVGRAVAGIGSAGLINGGVTIIAAAAPIDKRPKLIGFMLGIGQIGVMCGPIISGAFTQHVTWRWCFYLNLPPGGVVAALLVPMSLPHVLMKRNKDETWYSLFGKLDLPGFVIFAGAAIQALIALQWGGNKFAWGSATIIGLFCGAGVTAILFLTWEFRAGDKAMIPIGVISRRIVWCSLLVVFFFMGNMLITVYFLAIYFQSDKNDSPIMGGVSFLPGIVSQVIALVISGIFGGCSYSYSLPSVRMLTDQVTRVGYYLPFSVVGAAFMAIGTGLFTLLNPTSSTGTWIGYQIPAGIGRGMSMQMSVLAIQNDLPPPQIAIGTALLFLVQSFGGAVFVALGNTIFDTTLSNDLGKRFSSKAVQKIIDAGATNWRHIVQPAEATIVLDGYTHGLSNVFYLATACGLCMFFSSFGIGWKRIGKPKPKPAEAEATEKTSDAA